MPGNWWRFWARRPSPGRHVATRVTVFTRARCPLCDHAGAFLEGERERLGFQLEYVDIEGKVELTEQHGDWVPVVTVDGKVRFRGKIDPALWRRLMRE
jgi:glutaredoxin